MLLYEKERKGDHGRDTEKSRIIYRKHEMTGKSEDFN